MDFVCSAKVCWYGLICPVNCCHDLRSAVCICLSTCTPHCSLLPYPESCCLTVSLLSATITKVLLSDCQFAHLSALHYHNQSPTFCLSASLSALCYHNQNPTFCMPACLFSATITKVLLSACLTALSTDLSFCVQNLDSEHKN